MGKLTTDRRANKPDPMTLDSVLSRDRRSHRRYPITLRLQYKLLKSGRIQGVGLGQTIDISSGGALFEVDDELPDGGYIDLELNWPFLLQGSCKLKLVMRGRIVRRDGNTFGVHAEFHEFRTVGLSAFVGPVN